MRTFRNILALAITLSLGACATQQPTSTLAVGDRFFADPSASQGISTDWWTRYADPELNTLIQNALTNNHDIKLAVARVMEARAGLDAAFTRLLPTLSINGGQSEQRTTLPDPFKQRGSPDVKATRIGAELSWEVDLFGATRASQRAFEQNGLAAESAVHGARLLVSSEVAKQWFLLKSAKQQVALLASAIESLQKQRELIQLRREMGLSSQFDLDRVDSELNALIGQRPALAALEASLQARLAVLSGRSPFPECRIPQPFKRTTGQPSPRCCPVNPLNCLHEDPTSLRRNINWLQKASDCWKSGGIFYPRSSSTYWVERKIC